MGSARPPVEGAGTTSSHRNTPWAWSPAPRTPPRCCSRWPSPRTPTCSSTTSCSPSATCPGVGPVSTAGVVTEVRARHEGASFGSDVFLITDGVLPAHVQEIAEITTTRVEPECYVPPRPGDAWPSARPGLERDQALYFDQMDHKLPIGMGRDGAPIYVNLEFLDGTRGAHVSISGISGVATKTSFALFLLHSLFPSGVLGARAAQRQGAGLLRQGRGPAVPRPAQHPARRRPAGRLRRARPAGRARSPPSASSPRPSRTTRPDAHTSPAGPPA